MAISQLFRVVRTACTSRKQEIGPDSTANQGQGPSSWSLPSPARRIMGTDSITSGSFEILGQAPFLETQIPHTHVGKLVV